MLTFSQLPLVTQGKIAELSADLPVEILITDSRKIFATPHSLFFAIKGERHDGHQYIEEAYNAGIKNFVVEKYFPKLGLLEGANFFVAESSTQALQDLASYKRNHYNIPILAITGSNAKTIIKEWLAQLLLPDNIIIKSPKSYNSQIGVPLSVWPINERHTLGIFEAGISRPGEMENLERIIKPTIGLFTNIGSAHDEGFATREQKIREKIKLFKNVQTLVYCADMPEIDQVVKQEGIGSFTWGINPTADVVVKPLALTTGRSVYNFRYSNNNIYKDFNLELPFADAASVENMLHCIAVMMLFNVQHEEIQQRITSLKKVSMRLELKQGINNCYIIDDTYNNDLAGLTIALDFLNQQNQKPHKTLILSDLYETGLDEKTLYESIAKLLKDKGINRLIGIGGQISANSVYFEMESHFYLSTKNFLNAIGSLYFSNSIILIKGSRIFGFEKIVNQLQQKSHRTVLDINLDALAHNLNFYRSLLQPDTKTMVMVKSFAYGSGSLEVAQLLQFQRVDYLAVAYADEGVMLRENGIYLPIMVMNPTQESFEDMVHYRLEPVVYSQNELKELIKYLEDNASKLNIHLEIDTGMHRLGIDEGELSEVLTNIKNSERISVSSIFTHLAGADGDEFADFSKDQFAKLLRCSVLAENTLRYKIIKHILNSAGIVRYPDFQLDMVRLGIGLYGVEANGKLQDQLQPVSTLKTTISQIRKLSAGETVGYSRKWKLEKDATIAVLALGYGDGYSRSFSNGVGKVYLKGKYAPVVGNVCMDMTMIDISDIPEAKEGDEVEIFGKELSVIELAKTINTIPYEILTNVSERVKRVFYSE